MQRKIKWILFNAAILAVLIIVEILLIRSASGSGPTAEILVAGRAIEAGTVLTQELIEVRSVDAKIATDTALRTPGDAVGRKILRDTAEGEVLYAGSLNTETGNAGEFEDPGNRLFALELKGDAANGWWIAAGQRADVLFIPGSDKISDKVGVRGLGDRIENVRIAAILDEKGNRMEPDERGSVPRYVCLEVTPDQSVFLAFAKANGKIELAILPDGE